MKKDNFIKKVKLIHHTWLSAPNGANTVMNSLLSSNEQFAKYGIEISSLSPDLFVPRSFSSESQAQLKCSWRAKLKKLLQDATRYSALAADLMIYLTEIRPAKKIIKKYICSDPDKEEVAFFHTPVPCYFFLKKNINNQKVVVVLHTNGDTFKMVRMYYPALERSIVYKWMLKMEKYVLQHADKINFVAESAAKHFIELHPEVDPNKVSFIYNGVPNIIKATRTKPKTDVKEFCCVASISIRKGQQYIIDALKRFSRDNIPKVHFTLVGDGPDRNEMADEVVRLGLCDYITFAGISHNVDEYLANSDVYILPSEDEGLPMAIIEAMRASLPIVSTRVGGIPEMVEHEKNGLLISPSSSDIYDMLVHIDKYDWRSMGENARKTFEEKFSLSQMVEGYANILR